jgi:hypothetical protein
MRNKRKRIYNKTTTIKVYLLFDNKNQQTNSSKKKYTEHFERLRDVESSTSI